MIVCALVIVCCFGFPFPSFMNCLYPDLQIFSLLFFLLSPPFHGGDTGHGQSASSSVGA